MTCTNEQNHLVDLYVFLFRICFSSMLILLASVFFSFSKGSEFSCFDVFQDFETRLIRLETLETLSLEDQAVLG